MTALTPPAFLVAETSSGRRSPVDIACGDLVLSGELEMPADPSGVVIFVHDGASNRHGPRNEVIARGLRGAGLATLQFDLLTVQERWQATMSGKRHSDIDLLVERLVAATHWVQEHWRTCGLEIAYFGAGSGTAVALAAAARLGDAVGAIVSRGGRPDLVPDELRLVRTPTLFIAGGCDETIICLNGEAFVKLNCEKAFRIVSGATHLFEEPGKLEEVARISARWLISHLHAPAANYRRLRTEPALSFQSTSPSTRQ